MFGDSGGFNQLAKLVPALGEQLGPLEAGHALQDHVLVRSIYFVLSRYYLKA